MDFWKAVGDWFKVIGLVIAGSTAWTVGKIKTFFIGEVAIFLTAFVSMVIAVETNQRWLIFITTIISCMTAVIGRYVFSLVFKATPEILKQIPVGAKRRNNVDKTLNSLRDEAERLLKPVNRLALTLAFYGTMAIILGPNGLPGEPLIRYSVLFFVFILVLTVEPWKNYEKALLWTMGIILFSHVLFPIQSGNFVSWMRDRVTGISISKAKSVEGEDEIIISKGTPYFERARTGFTDTNKKAEQNTRAKIISHRQDDRSGESMYEVILEKQNGLYIGGEIFWVPKRMISKARNAHRYDKKANKTPTYPTLTKKERGKVLYVPLKPGESMDVDTIKENGEWEYRGAADLISHRIKPGNKKACWRKVHKDKPWKADCKGTLEVKNLSPDSILFKVVIL